MRLPLQSYHVRLLVVLAAVCLLVSCNNQKKFLVNEERTLYRNHFNIEMDNGQKPPSEILDALSDMRKYSRQQPNSHLLGIGPRVKMRIYCASKPNKDNWWNRNLRRQGQAPVIYDEMATWNTCEQISGLLESKGCFGSTVSFDTIRKGRYDLVVNYHIHPTIRYRIDDVSFRSETSEVTKLLKQWQNESLLKAGDYYDQEKLDEERSRLSERLRNEGYYLAATNLITFLVDSAFEDHKLTIRVNVRNPHVVDSNKTVTIVPLQKYHIDDIFIYPNTSTSTASQISSYDTLVDRMSFRNRYTDYHYLYNQPMTLKPRVIDRNLFLFHGQTFRPRNTERTYNSLLSLRNFKYINIEYSESPNSSDTNRLLNAKVRLLNAKRQRLSTSVEINNSSPFGEQNQGLMSGNMGLETKIGYQNKNLFGGAELFKAEWSLLIELPKLFFKNDENDFHKNVSSFEHGIDLSLDLPTFLFPFSGDVLWQRMRPHTVFTLGGDYQYRSYFERLLFNTGFGYSWNNNQHAHQLLPVELTFVRFFNIDSAFKARMQSISDARVKYQYSNHFIMDARYDYVYNSQQYNTRYNFNYFHLSLETAGNLLNAICSVTGSKTDESGVKQMFGVPFSQYARINTEYKHYFYLGKKSTFVARIMAGVGIPYSNSSIMPYEKGFYGGGPTTIRAWHLRYLGPGTFQSSNNNVLERVGDIQLVLNAEYRFPLISLLEGALFVDAGNVWLVNNSSEFPGGQFSFKDFYKSIATGIGIGVRANISIVTLRADFAIPLYDPGANEDKQWRPHYWKFNQITVNFGIDYPF